MRFYCIFMCVNFKMWTSHTRSYLGFGISGILFTKCANTSKPTQSSNFPPMSVSDTMYFFSGCFKSAFSEFCTVAFSINFCLYFNWWLVCYYQTLIFSYSPQTMFWFVFHVVGSMSLINLTLFSIFLLL